MSVSDVVKACLTCRDKEDLVVMEAIKSMFGCLPSAAGPLFSAAPGSEDLKDAKMRARAWALVSSEAKRPAVYTAGLQVCQDILSLCVQGG